MSTASFTSTIPQKLSPRKQLSFLKHHFTKGSFENLVGIVRSSLKNHKGGNLSVMAEDVGKCVSSISYFFNDAVWRVTDIRDALRLRLLRADATRIEVGDLAAFDGSSISKKGTCFQFIGETWDNADKATHRGYTLLMCAIVQVGKNTRWVFDEILYSNKDPKFQGIFPYTLRLLRRLFAVTSIMLVVFDSGFRNQYLLKYVVDQGRNFILRVTLDMVVWSASKEKKCTVLDIVSMAGAHTKALSVNGKSGWRVTWYSGIMNAWMRQIKVPLSIVLIHRPSFHKPMALVTSLAVENAEDALHIYTTYLNRWKIEMLFQDIKELGLESFRVRRKVAIMKYLTLVILVHSLLTLMLHFVRSVQAFCSALEHILKSKRKIPTLRFRGMKLFYELFLQGRLSVQKVVTVAIHQDILYEGR